MIFSFTLSAAEVAAAVGLLLLVLGIVYVLGYNIGHADGELFAYDYMTEWILHIFKDGDDNAE